jgi:hypothetical protein
MWLKTRVSNAWWWIAGFALAGAAGSCAHGVEGPLAESQDGLGGGGNGGDGGSAMADASGSDVTSEGGSGGTAGASSGGAAGSSGAAGTAGAGGTGGGAADAAGTGGGAGDAGDPSLDGSGGTAGNGGAPGSGGDAGGGGNGGAAGTVDAGPRVPMGVTVGTQRTDTALQAPSTGGTVFRDNCPADAALIGYTGTTEPAGSATSYLRSFQPICGRFTVTGTTTFTITTAQVGTLPVRGMPFSATQTRSCPMNQVIVGFSGRSGGFIDQLAFRCAPLTITGAAPSYAISIGTATTLTGLGGTGGNAFNTINCPNGQIAVSNTGRAQTAINAFGLACATPTIEVSP